MLSLALRTRSRTSSTASAGDVNTSVLPPQQSTVSVHEMRTPAPKTKNNRRNQPADLERNPHVQTPDGETRRAVDGTARNGVVITAYVCQLQAAKGAQHGHGLAGEHYGRRMLA